MSSTAQTAQRKVTQSSYVLLQAFTITISFGVLITREGYVYMYTFHSLLVLCLGGCVFFSPAICRSYRSELKPYQMVGLNWLALLHVRDLNGILADEMVRGNEGKASLVIVWVFFFCFFLCECMYQFMVGVTGRYKVFIQLSFLFNRSYHTSTLVLWNFHK